MTTIRTATKTESGDYLVMIRTQYYMDTRQDWDVRLHLAKSGKWLACASGTRNLTYGWHHVGHCEHDTAESILAAIKAGTINLLSVNPG